MLLQQACHNFASPGNNRALACLSWSRVVQHHCPCHRRRLPLSKHLRKVRVEFFLAPFFFFFGARCFFFCGWLVSARTVPLLQAVAGKSWNFCRVQGFATQHSFWGLGFCNPTLLLGLKVLQPNIPFRASGFCNSTFLLGLKLLQPNTSFRAQGCCKPTLLLGLKVLQPNTPFRA